MTRQIITGIITAAALFIAGCSTTPSIQPTDNSVIAAKGGTLKLSFSSADETEGLAKNIFTGAHGDADAVEHIWLAIKEVQIHTSGNAEENGWQTVATPGARFDFLELVNGLTAPLGLHALPAGHYTQIRLFLEDQVENEYGEYPNAVIINGESFPLKIPSVYKTGIKCVRSFFIEEDEVTEICLRFDVIKAIHYTKGNGYMMHPAYQTYKCDGSDDSDEDEDTNNDDEEEDDDEDDDDDDDYDEYYYETYYNE